MNSTRNPAVLANAKDFIIQDASFINAQTVNIGAEGLGRLLGSAQNINTDPENNGLPPRPKLFVGREDIVAKITSTLVSSNHAALVGTGGIGKSYIATAILHENDIMAKFKQHRYFIRYDNVNPLTLNFETFLDRIVGSLEVIARPGEDRRDAVLQHIRNIKNNILLVLDNAETFLDSKHELKPISDFVVELGDMTSVSLMFTTRRTAIPPLVGCAKFDIPGLEQIPAREAFMSIYKSDISPEIVDNLLSAVEFHPLSITLLANASAVNNWSPRMLEKAWGRESALVLEKSGTGGFGITVEVSLKSPSIAKLGENGRQFLHVVAFLPQGVHYEKLNQIFPSITNIHDISDAMCVHSLTYRNGNFITMLAPIRLYISLHYAKEVARDICYESTVRTYYRDLLVDGDKGWVVDEDANVECLVVLDLETPNERAIIACIAFMSLSRRMFRYCLAFNLDSLVLALPEDPKDRPQTFHRIFQLFTRPGLIRLFHPAPSRALIDWPQTGSKKMLQKAEGLLALVYIKETLGSSLAGMILLDQGGRLFFSQKEWARGIKCLLLRALILENCGQFSKAAEMLKQVHHLCRKFGYLDLQAAADFFTGQLLISKGNPEEASLCEGANTALQKPDRTLLNLRIISLVALGDSTLRLRDSSSAEEYYNTSMKQPNLDQADEIKAKIGLISVAFAKGEVGYALQMRDELAIIHPTMEALRTMFLVLSKLADWGADEGRFSDARDHIHALNIAQEKLNVYHLGVKFSEARVELFDQCFIKAHELLIALKDLSREFPMREMQICRALGEIAILENNHETAKGYFSQVKAYCDKEGVNPEIFGGNKFYNCLTNEITQKDIFRGWPEFLEQEDN